MRCYNCHCFSLLSFCDACYQELSELSLGFRELEEGFKVYYFYKYSEIKHLLHSKHKFHGYFVLNSLAKLSFAKFKDMFKIDSQITAIALDDRVENSLYSHSAILARQLKSKAIKLKFGVLHSRSKCKYSGKSVEFRLKNKRDYVLLKPLNSPVILVDDIVTTGLSILEAKKTLAKHGIETLFALVLADAKQ